MIKLKCKIKDKNNDIETRMIDANTSIHTAYSAFDTIDNEKEKLNIPVLGIDYHGQKLYPYATKDGLLIPIMKAVMVEEGPNVKYLSNRPYYQLIPMHTLEYIFNYITEDKKELI